MSKKLIDLSRRKILGSIGAIGATSAGAGLGTSAYFNDTEEFTSNSFTAGELDLKVDYQYMYWGPESGPYGSAGRPFVSAWPDEDDDGVRDNTNNPGDDDDLTQPLADLSDMKPGDSGCLDVGLELVDNPGYICVSGSLSESENGMSEPEADVDDSPDEGELGKHIQATLFYDTDGDSVTEDGCEIDDDDIVLAEGSLRQVFKHLDQGVPLTDDEDACIAGGQRHTVVLHYELPAETGNVVQTDSATFDLTFYTEQCRHNDLDSFDDHPCATCFQTDLHFGQPHDLDEDGTIGDDKITHRWGSTADYDEHSQGTSGADGISIENDISWSNGTAEVTIDVTDPSTIDADVITFASYYAKCPPNWKGEESKKYQLLLDTKTIDVSEGTQTLTVDIPHRIA
jgi:predicted ribosomally synthesized peptide with SipW-like signal peptide